jgi:hypothetical protein
MQAVAIRVTLSMFSYTVFMAVTKPALQNKNKHIRFFGTGIISLIFFNW